MADDDVGWVMNVGWDGRASDARFFWMWEEVYGFTKAFWVCENLYRITGGAIGTIAQLFPASAFMKIGNLP